MQKLRLRNFVGSDEAFHVARTHVPEHAPSVHTHDFAEVFWIESGSGTHLINSRREPLRAGDVVFIQPSDEHGFQARGPGGFVLVNVAFAAGVLDWLREQYGPLPGSARLEAAQVERLRQIADALAVSPKSRLVRDGFLLQLLAMLSAEDRIGGPVAALPGWLRHAVGEFGRPAHMAGGTQAFARLAGRSPEHINRVFREALGKTTTDVVNEIRLEYAARQLRMTDQKIAEIALDCGLANLGHFYDLFQKRFQCTPRHYRLRHQSLVR
jgi:AraC-like DNA-binding protein